MVTDIANGDYNIFIIPSKKYRINKRGYLNLIIFYVNLFIPVIL